MFIERVPNRSSPPAVLLRESYRDEQGHESERTVWPVAVGYRGREGSRDPASPTVVAPAERLGVMDAAGGLYTTVRSLARRTRDDAVTADEAS